MYPAIEHAEHAVSNLRESRNDRWYPAVHIAARAGWLNDPNGLCYHDGRYHVYFQHHPYTAEWGLMHWGHVSSADLITWRREPIAMAPSVEGDRDGVFSGSAIVRDDGALAVLYTAHRWRNGINEDEGNLQSQCLAVSRDGGRTFEKAGVVIECPQDLIHFRDPKVWKQSNGSWYLVVGVCSPDRRGQVWLYRCDQPDLSVWEFDRILYESANPEVFMLECPDFFRLGDQWVLMFSPMGTNPRGFELRNEKNAVYVVGDWTPGTDFKARSDWHSGDCGANYYAPQTFETPDSRRILFGWMGPDRQPQPNQTSDGWCGNLTTPRELRLNASGEGITTRPISEFEHLRAATVDVGAFSLAPHHDRVLLEEQLSPLDVELEIDLTGTTAERVTLSFNGKTACHETVVSYDAQTNRVVLDRRHSGQGDQGYRSAAVPDVAWDLGKLVLRIILDKASVEVFVGSSAQEYEDVISSAIFPTVEPSVLVINAECGEAEISALKIHSLRSIWHE